MRQNKKTKVLEVFYEYPNGSFSIRDISKLTRVPRATVHKILKELKKENLITKENKVKDSLIFKTKKINYFIEMIITSGLIEEIINQLNPSCIILFGSFRKGEDVSASDIDISVEKDEFKENRIVSFRELGEFEKQIGRKIQIHEFNRSLIDTGLFNNIANGIILIGFLEVKK